MHLHEISIKNLFSFVDTTFKFNEYNVVVGTNNAGKTNLLRIIKKMKESGSLLGFTLASSMKFFPAASSQLKLKIKLTNEELRILLQSIFRVDFSEMVEFSDKLMNIQLVINWNNMMIDDPPPSSVFIMFENNITVITNYDDCLILNHKASKSPINKEKFFDELFKKDFQIEYELGDFGFSVDPNISISREGLQDLVDENPLEKYFIGNDIVKVPNYDTTISFDINKPVKYSSDIFEFLNRPKNAVSNIHFIEVMSSILKKSFILIEEIHPSYSQLTNEIFNLKVVDENAYDILKNVFSELFDNALVKVEQEKENEGNRRIIITEKNRKFELKESASGYYAALHILHSILDRPDRILILDEPEIHFHPVKIRQLSQKFMELATKSRNQIIVISHSPKFVDFRLLDPGFPFTLTNVTKEVLNSEASSLPSQIDLKLGPHLFNPEMFFGKCSLLVEGADDEFVMRSISDRFDGVLDKYGITIINCWGVANVFPNIQLHNAFNIPYHAMVDKEYNDDMESVTRLTGILETELEKIGWVGTKNQLKPVIAYQFIQECLETKEGFENLKKTEIWKAFTEVLKNSSKDKTFDFEKFFN
ncbi:AAA family ATPase [Nitrosopumilus adriaticus]|uniref:AAA family ATPase n=1 Tax=Nitrosopumilus adriaticus TaxID=1580092 RepID=UPI00352E577B